MIHMQIYKYNPSVLVLLVNYEIVIIHPACKFAVYFCNWTFLYHILKTCENSVK